MEYSPLTWMSSAQCHLSQVYKVQMRAERLIHPTDDQYHMERRPRQQCSQLDSLGHRRRVGALTVLHKAQVQHSSNLAGLQVQWRRSERATRTVVSGDLLLGARRTHTGMGQRAFTWATATLWNTFTVEVDAVAMNTQQCHSITSVSGVGFDSLHRLAANFTICVFISLMCGTAAVKMFHILETRPTKVTWCWLARERGTSTASPLVSTVLVLRVVILGGCRSPARCGTPCTCALWNTTSAATSLQSSSESRGLTGSNWAGGSGGSAASTSR
ncbi:hypothetical protein GWK47_008472 [Chionoecetes opilio]|uniref:Uncharacterized protein n=1 Tax=Chionoecetes opilio TaxID=41210 RepID=A0A8J4Y554_CHIOP|nr:hypothetical protein GWK47_008472 [Chionoecetes opilio]